MIIKMVYSDVSQRQRKIPNKTIDYLIFTKFFEVGEHYIRNNDTLLISDHLLICSDDSRMTLQSVDFLVGYRASEWNDG